MSLEWYMDDHTNKSKKIPHVLVPIMLKVPKKLPINYCEIFINYYNLIVESGFWKIKKIIWHLKAKPKKVPWYVLKPTLHCGLWAMSTRHPKWNTLYTRGGGMQMKHRVVLTSRVACLMTEHHPWPNTYAFNMCIKS